MEDQTNKRNLRELSSLEIENYLIDIGEPKFRSKQIYQWLWQKAVASIDEMTNLSISLRDRLSQDFFIERIALDMLQESRDGTIKFRFKMADGALIESVLIPVPRDKRFTVCVSSQVGCSLSCSFCATGKMKRIRNLTPGEIVDQIVEVNKKTLEVYDAKLTNIVYMGMGEPLLSYKNVLQSIDHISSPNGLAMSSRRITLSTAGIAKMIMKLADDASKVNLALSLHAADDEKRNKIMPINEQNDLSSLMDALSYYYNKTRNKISYEYIAFQNFNDGIEDADRLADLCKQFPVMVNIIEYNPIEGFDMLKSKEDRIDLFARRLRKHGVMVTLRRSRGKDIDAACGQLANID